MIQKSNIERVLSVFFIEPTKEHYLKEISKKSRLAHTSTKNVLDTLEKEKLIFSKVEKRGKRDFPIYFANYEDHNFRKKKKIFNINKIEDSGILEFLSDNLMPRSIVLFGSCSRGEDIEDSDIDIFVEANSKKISLDKFERLINKKIQLHIKSRFSDYPKELKNNIINGIVLRGYLEVFR